MASHLPAARSSLDPGPSGDRCGHGQALIVTVEDTGPGLPEMGTQMPTATAWAEEHRRATGARLRGGGHEGSPPPSAKEPWRSCGPIRSVCAERRAAGCEADAEMTTKLRVVIADDERPARSYLTSMLRRRPDVDRVGEAETGVEAVALIERERPDLAFLDLQMPELDGLGVVRVLKRKVMPLVVFVTAYEEYALRAFELNAVDYLLKPANPARLGEALTRAHDRLERLELRSSEVDRVKAAVDAYEAEARLPWLERSPVRHRDVVMLLPVKHIASIVAERELLHITTARNEKHTITYRLKDLEMRLPSSKFVRLGRGTLAAIGMIVKVQATPGGGYVVTLSNGEELQVSRIQSRVVRERLLKL